MRQMEFKRRRSLRARIKNESGENRHSKMYHSRDVEGEQFFIKSIYAVTRLREIPRRFDTVVDSTRRRFDTVYDNDVILLTSIQC